MLHRHEALSCMFYSRHGIATPTALRSLFDDKSYRGVLFLKLFYLNVRSIMNQLTDRIRGVTYFQANGHHGCIFLPSMNSTSRTNCLQPDGNIETRDTLWIATINHSLNKIYRKSIRRRPLRRDKSKSPKLKPRTSRTIAECTFHP